MLICVSTGFNAHFGVITRSELSLFCPELVAKKSRVREFCAVQVRFFSVPSRIPYGRVYKGIRGHWGRCDPLLGPICVFTPKNIEILGYLAIVLRGARVGMGLSRNSTHMSDLYHGTIIMVIVPFAQVAASETDKW